MGTRDPRIDIYIAESADFAQPILNHIRELVHIACPDVEEGMKWSFPHFMYKGILCSMASFKGHCAFGFWNEKAMGEVMGAGTSKKVMWHFGRITTLADLPKDKVLMRYIKEAAKLNDAGVKRPSRAKPAGERTLDVPEYFMAALKKNKKALKTFEGFSYSNRKEYVQWVTEAKTEATRMKRLETAIEWMAEGKVKNWKYLNC